MKKLLVILTAIAFVVGFSTASLAVITGSAHDFQSSGWTTEICLPCHTPHNADTSVAEAPLWNHALTVETFTLYSSTTLNATMAQPDGVSKLCLSCHDGTVALDSFGGTTGSNTITGTALLGNDLKDDHPISFTYDTALATADTELVDPSADGDANADTVGMATPYLPLFGGKMQCASCHDVHNGTGEDHLLLKNNGGSALCLTCHSK